MSRPRDRVVFNTPTTGKQEIVEERRDYIQKGRARRATKVASTCRSFLINATSRFSKNGNPRFGGAAGEGGVVGRGVESRQGDGLQRKAAGRQGTDEVVTGEPGRARHRGPARRYLRPSPRRAGADDDHGGAARAEEVGDDPGGVCFVGGRALPQHVEALHVEDEVEGAAR